MKKNDPLPPYARGSATSRAAAEAMQPKRRKQALRVLDQLRQAPDGMTSDEVEVGLKLPHQSASARINELRAAGCLIETKLRRRTRAGAEAAVYVVAPDASDEKFERWLVQHRNAQDAKETGNLWEKRLVRAATVYAGDSSPQNLTELAMVARQAPLSHQPRPIQAEDDEADLLDRMA